MATPYVPQEIEGFKLKAFRIKIHYDDKFVDISKFAGKALIFVADDDLEARHMAVKWLIKYANIDTNVRKLTALQLTLEQLQRLSNLSNELIYNPDLI